MGNNLFICHFTVRYDCVFHLGGRITGIIIIVLSFGHLVGFVDKKLEEKALRHLWYPLTQHCNDEA